MALSVGGLIRREGGGLIAGQKKANETLDIIKQNENLYLKQRGKCILLFFYLLIKEICT